MGTNGRSREKESGDRKREKSLYSIVAAFEGFVTEIPGIDSEQCFQGR